MSLLENVWLDVERIRELRPLVINVTNDVVANTTANALLALGASPAMSHHPRDLEELVSFAGALVVNIGTPTPGFLEGMAAAGKAAREHGKPMVLDPVAAGATTIRTDTALGFLKDFQPAVVRGNGSEIMALAGAGGAPHGVDSSQSSEDAVASAVQFAELFGCTASVSGEVDYVTDGTVVYKITGGHAMMPLVTGLGCTASALTGAFVAVNADAVQAGAHAMAVMAACGSWASRRAEGPGTLQLHFYDALYKLDRGMLGECGLEALGAA